jgi:glucose-6-phosphate isomerase
MFPYADKLKLFSAWFVQLWGESLGKKNKSGERFGSTPIQALGATDQHSQLQLYLGGPKDKFFTFLEVGEKADLEVADLEIDHSAYVPLRKHGLKNLLKAELHATYETLRGHELPIRLITLPAINAYYLGQLMFNTVLETLAVASIWDVNPFDQPAVEEGKILALKFLNDKK